MAEKKTHRRKSSLRLRHFDYTSEACYFVTIASRQKKRHFEGFKAKSIIKQQLRGLENRFGIVIDCFVIMPDHIHLMVALLDAGQISLSGIIQAFKSLVAKRFREKLGIYEKIWQRGFYDHIIRNERDYLEKKRYILQNPLKEELLGRR